MLVGSPATALIGVGLAGLAGVLILFQVLLSERRRHEVAEGELAGQALFMESLVDSFGAIAAILDEDEIIELTRSEAERLFSARAAVLAPGEEGPAGPAESRLLLPLRTREEQLASIRLVRADPFGREDSIRAAVFADFASQAIENAKLLAEARVREAERARLSDQLVTAEQEERRRLALFLHDTSVQSLAGIALMLDAALNAIREDRPEEAQTVMSGALVRHRATIRALRDLSFNLEPVVLRDQGLGPAVGELAQQLGMEKEVQIDVDVRAGEQLSKEAQAGLYQIIREALHAALRRGPRRITVRVEAAAADGGVEATIADDAPAERRRASFEAITERARTLSGRLDVEHGADADAGTTVRVSLPPFGG